MAMTHTLSNSVDDEYARKKKSNKGDRGFFSICAEDRKGKKTVYYVISYVVAAARQRIPGNATLVRKKTLGASRPADLTDSYSSLSGT